MNFTREDLSSFRINNVLMQDPRLSKLPFKYNNRWGGSLSVHWSMTPSVDDF